MPQSHVRFACLYVALGLLSCLLCDVQQGLANDGQSSLVRFDTSAIAAAHPVSEPYDLEADLGVTRWCIPIELSAFVASPNAPAIEQIIFEIELLNAGLSIDDYCPRTQLASPLATDISIEHTTEDSKHVGVKAAGNYGLSVRGDMGGDVGQKKVESRKFQRVAPMEIVAASGTLQRGTAVFFKLRRTPTQVLEGDKAFKIFVRSPATWRGGLIEIRATAQATRRGFPGLPNEAVSLGQQRFLVAVYQAGDAEAYQFANRLVTAESELRASAAKYQEVIRRRSEKNVFQQVAAKLDLSPTPIPSDWLQQTIFGVVDPHADPAIRRLPVNVRVALLDYQEARDVFREYLQGQHVAAGEEPSKLVAK